MGKCRVPDDDCSLGVLSRSSCSPSDRGLPQSLFCSFKFDVTDKSPFFRFQPSKTSMFIEGGLPKIDFCRSRQSWLPILDRRRGGGSRPFVVPVVADNFGSRCCRQD